MLMFNTHNDNNHLLKKIDEASVNIQLDELFDKSIDDNSEEKQNNKNDNQDDSSTSFLKNNGFKKHNEPSNYFEVTKPFKISRSNIDDIKTLFNFNSLLFLKQK